MLFKEIELIVRKHLFITFERGSSIDSGQRETIISAVASDDSAILLDHAISGYRG